MVLVGARGCDHVEAAGAVRSKRRRCTECAQYINKSSFSNWNQARIPTWFKVG